MSTGCMKCVGCGKDTWVGVWVNSDGPYCQICKPPMPAEPSCWICLRCGRSNAPHVLHCDCENGYKEKENNSPPLGVAGWAWDAYLHAIRQRWAPGALNPHEPDVIASRCGWLPLEPGESMTVHYGGVAYKITREIGETNGGNDVA
jgi:hypothetical protein